MAPIDNTYGKMAEVWPRDYNDVEKSLKFLRFKQIPVRAYLEDGRSFSLYVYSLLSGRHKLDLTPTPDSHENRARLPLERVSTIETIDASEVQTDFVGRLTVNADEYVMEPSKRDFFLICREAHQAGKSIRVFMRDGRVIEGVSAGVHDSLVFVRLERHKQVIVMFDWVERITLS